MVGLKPGPIPDCCNQPLKGLRDDEWVAYSTKDGTTYKSASALWAREVHENQRCGYLCPCACGYQAICKHCIKRLGLVW